MPQVKVITLDTPVLSIGKEFTGPYELTPEFIMELQLHLETESLDYDPYKVLSIYLDDPSAKAPQALKSFHAMIAPKAQTVEAPYRQHEMQGLFLHAKAEGNPAEGLPAAYEALFQFAAERNLEIESRSAHQITTFENDSVAIELYLKLK